MIKWKILNSMKTSPKKVITLEAEINASVEKVWDYYTKPDHIVKWNNASDDWHTPRAENDLRTGGRFLSRMEARDGSSGFDFTGVYTDVKPLKQINYTLDDDRKVEVSFLSGGNVTPLRITFETEQTNPVEIQKEVWQS
ncbi:MAG TPA: SRPBCC domain-containing protein, partial [Candidatus Cloacimonadota bacterium]|nr:SRPBCC domain-containing protein [Candidatus Cloacimonadota bacterium]